MKLKYTSWLLLGLFATVSVACNNDDDEQSPGPAALVFTPEANGTVYQLGTAFTTPSGDEVKISQFRVWITNVSLTATNGAVYEVPDSYYLVQRWGNPATQQVEVRERIELANVPPNEYNQISFSVGPDSSTNSNVDDYEVGELQAGIGMNWSWNMGYIFMKAEGTYLNRASSSDSLYRMHIGTNPNYRTVTLTLPETLRVDGEQSGTPEVRVSANLEDLFDNIDVQTNPIIMVGPRPLAERVADNYATMFEVEAVTNP